MRVNYGSKQGFTWSCKGGGVVGVCVVGVTILIEARWPGEKQTISTRNASAMHTQNIATLTGRNV